MTEKFNNYLLVGEIKALKPISVDTPKIKGFPINIDGLKYISASTIRGVLRHNAHSVLAMYLDSKGVRLKLEDHFALAVGYDLYGHGKSKITQIDYGAYLNKIRDSNAFISLFGRWLLSSKLNVGNAYTRSENSTTVTDPSGLSNVFETNPELIPLLDIDTLSELENILMSSSKNKAGETYEVLRLQKELKEYQEKIEKNEFPMMQAMYQAKVQALEAELITTLRETKKKKLNKKIDQVEVIRQGEVLDIEIRARNCTKLEFETLLFSIYALSLNPSIGAKFCTGLGEIEADWKIYRTNIFNSQPEEIGVVGFNKNGFYSKMTTPEYEPFDIRKYFSYLDDKQIKLDVNY